MLKSRKKKTSDINIKKRKKGSQPITGAPTAVTAFLGHTNLGPFNEPRQVNNFAEFERVYGGLSPDSELGPGVSAFFRNGGKRAYIVRLDPNDQDGINGNQALQTGLYALDKADIFNLLCIPPIRGNDIEPTIFNQAVRYCVKRRAMLIIDPPSSWDSVQAAIKGFPLLGLKPSPNAAIYFPRLKEPNPMRKDRIESFAPSGAIAGVIARTDDQHGVWKAPAGTQATLTGVSGLSISINDAENNQLNSLGINCLRTIPPLGHLVWGARTLAGADNSTSEWKYVSVRRLAIFLEKSIHQGTSWTVFEPNDEPLWIKLCEIIGTFLQDLFKQGAFQGIKSSDAYFVKCDNQTTTQNDIQKGIINILVGFAPLKPAEFVVLKISLMAASP
jgi:phage tail sheath protein FI